MLGDSMTKSGDADLTSEQKKHVRNSWTHTKTKCGSLKAIGVALFVRLFEDNPTIMSRFSFTKGLLLEELRVSPEFLLHATAVASTLERAILALEAPPSSELLLYLRALGRKHFHVGVSEDLFPVLEETLMDTLRAVLGEGFTVEVRQAWSAIFNLVTNGMKAGMKPSGEIKN